MFCKRSFSVCSVTLTPKTEYFINKKLIKLIVRMESNEIVIKTDDKNSPNWNGNKIYEIKENEYKLS